MIFMWLLSRLIGNVFNNVLIILPLSYTRYGYYTIRKRSKSLVRDLFKVCGLACLLLYFSLSHIAHGGNSKCCIFFIVKNYGHKAPVYESTMSKISTMSKRKVGSMW